MSSKNSQSNGEESISIVGSEEVKLQQGQDGHVEVLDDPEGVERMTVSSFSSSISGGSQSATDTEGEEGGDEERQALLAGSDAAELSVAAEDTDDEDDGEPEPGTAEDILGGPETRGRAASRLVMFSLILIIVPLTAMYISYRFVFTDHYHFPRDRAVLYAGLVAAALVYVILGIFAWIAYRDERGIAERIEETKKEE